MKTPRSAVVVACIALALGVAGCGSNGDGQSGNGPFTNESGGQPGQADGPGGTRGPGWSRRVGQGRGRGRLHRAGPGTGRQVAVTWTSKTAFTQQVSATAEELKVGDCVRRDARPGDWVLRRRRHHGGGGHRADRARGRRLVHRWPARPGRRSPGGAGQPAGGRSVRSGTPTRSHGRLRQGDAGRRHRVRDRVDPPR